MLTVHLEIQMAHSKNRNPNRMNEKNLFIDNRYVEFIPFGDFSWVRKFGVLVNQNRVYVTRTLKGTKAFTRHLGGVISRYNFHDQF